MATVNKNGLMIEFASEDLWRDRYIVMSEVKMDGCALKFA